MTAARIFGALEKARKDLGLTQEAVAERIGMTRANFARMEGGFCLPGSLRLIQWCDALGIELVSSPKQADGQ